MAHAASTALPPCMKMRAPAVAASGLPVMATQFWPCRVGLTVFASKEGVTAMKAANNSATEGRDHFISFSGQAKVAARMLPPSYRDQERAAGSVPPANAERELTAD